MQNNKRPFSDIMPPKKPEHNKPATPPLAPVAAQPAMIPAPAPLIGGEPDIEKPDTVQPSGPPNGKKPDNKRRVRKIIKWVAIGLAAVIIGVFLSAFAWYNAQMAPMTDDKSIHIPVVIELGSTPDQIGQLLADKSIIRSSTAFDVYTYLTDTRNKLQAGSYMLSPADSTQTIVDHLVEGKVEQLQVTFYPGATLRDTTDRPANQKTDVVTQLRKAGFAQTEIDEALAASYDSPLFEGKPANADLEGYVYGETYSYNGGASAKEVLEIAFDEFYEQLTDNDLISKFKQHGLNLYEAITLASIVQREVNDPADQKQVAQVFYSRLDQGMVLGSDVTYQYIADKLGVARDTELNNPYNTRKFAGLPPGPIAAPGLGALKAVAEPAPGNFLYFLSGDDDKTYFARTNAEHEDNKAKYCVVKCSTL